MGILLELLLGLCWCYGTAVTELYLLYWTGSRPGIGASIQLMKQIASNGGVPLTSLDLSLTHDRPLEDVIAEKVFDKREQKRFAQPIWVDISTVYVENFRNSL